jgi:hypothetical protein
VWRPTRRPKGVGGSQMCAQCDSGSCYPRVPYAKCLALSLCQQQFKAHRYPLTRSVCWPTSLYRYTPERPFELVSVSGVVSHKELAAKGTEVWLVQLPPHVRRPYLQTVSSYWTPVQRREVAREVVVRAQVDVKELTGGKLKLVESTRGEDRTADVAMGTFQAPSGACPCHPPCPTSTLYPLGVVGFMVDD